MPFFVGALDALCSFQFVWLDFVFVGAKIKIFSFAQGKNGKRRGFFKKMCIFAFQMDEIWNPTTILKTPNPQ